MDLLNEDVDKVLSYNTKQQVKILDRWLGLVNYFVTMGIVVYIVGYVFIVDEGYLKYEQARGIIVTHTRGDVAAMSSGKMKTRSFAADEINYPGLENGNVFIATKVEIHRQNRRDCEDTDRSCQEDGHCASGSKCGESGFCHEPSWCSAKDDQPEIYKLPTENAAIWVKSAIQFYSLNKERPRQEGKVFTTNMQEPIAHPDTGQDQNTWSVKELLLLCDPPVRYEEISELGAAIEVTFSWACNAKKDACAPTIKARRIDAILDKDNIGFKFSYPVYDVGDEDSRRLFKVRGIRFYMRTVGVGRMVSVAVIIFKISTGIALLVLAPILTDWLMLRCFVHAKKYNARKYEHSQDFGDYFEELERRGQQSQVEEEEEEEEDLEEEKQWRRRMEEEDD